jgi:hypothetical protein
MELTFALPGKAAERAASVYYQLVEDFSLIEDLQRADVGQLRFFLSGSGYHEFPDGERAHATPVFLTGPSNRANRFSVQGPLRFVGISLQAAAWGGLIPADADALADRSADAVDMLGPEVLDLRRSLGACTTIDEMAPLLDAFVAAKMRPVPDDHARAIEAIRAWIADHPYPRVDDLYAAAPFSQRQMMRIANRYYGAPPKLLARKYIALRTASHIFMNDGTIRDRDDDYYSDRSHLIREVRHFTGLTPRQLKTMSSRLMRVTLASEHFRELEPLG